MGAVRITRITGFAATVAIGVLGPLSVAGAVDYPNDGNPPTVSPNQQPKTVARNTATRSATLPITGTDVAGLLTIGGAAVGVGFVVTRRSRRTTPA